MPKIHYNTKFIKKNQQTSLRLTGNAPIPAVQREHIILAVDPCKQSKQILVLPRTTTNKQINKKHHHQQTKTTTKPSKQTEREREREKERERGNNKRKEEKRKEKTKRIIIIPYTFSANTVWLLRGDFLL